MSNAPEQTTLPYGRTVVGKENLVSAPAYAIYIDEVNNRLGINKTLPEYNLDVFGSAKCTSLIVDGNASCKNMTASNLTVSSISSLGTVSCETVSSEKIVGNSFMPKTLMSDVGSSTSQMYHVYTGNIISLGKLDLAAAESTEISSSSSFVPSSAGKNLGSDTKKWENLFVGDAVRCKNIIPNTDISGSCGSNGNRWTDIWAQNGSIQTSDRNMKKDIVSTTMGLNFISALDPVSYRFITRENRISYHDETKTENQISYREVESKTYVPILDANGNPVLDSEGKETFTSEIIKTVEEVSTPVSKIVKVQDITPMAGLRRHQGLISQQVKTVMDNMNITPDDFAGYIYDETTNTYGLRYEEFIAPIIKSIQELSVSSTEKINETKSNMTAMSIDVNTLRESCNEIPALKSDVLFLRTANESCIEIPMLKSDVLFLRTASDSMSALLSTKPECKIFSFVIPESADVFEQPHDLDISLIKGFECHVMTDEGLMKPNSASDVNYLYDAKIKLSTLCIVPSGVGVQGKTCKWIVWM